MLLFFWSLSISLLMFKRIFRTRSASSVFGSVPTLWLLLFLVSTIMFIVTIGWWHSMLSTFLLRLCASLMLCCFIYLLPSFPTSAPIRRIFARVSSLLMVWFLVTFSVRWVMIRIMSTSTLLSPPMSLVFSFLSLRRNWNTILQKQAFIDLDCGDQPDKVLRSKS